MRVNKDFGSRFIITLVDQYAFEDPSRVWAAVPIEEDDLSKGFKNITFAELSNAINHAATWMQKNLPIALELFETIAYAGPKDLRYPIIALAAAKVDRKLLLPSPYASAKAQTHLIAASNCRFYLHASALGADVKKLLSYMGRDSTIALEIPHISEWLTEEKAPIVPFNKKWEEGQHDPWLIFHTSGTTGIPKLVTYTHRMMSSLDAAELMPDADHETINRHIENKRWYTPLPSLHFVGMSVALQFTVYLAAVLVVGPATSGPASPQIAKEVMSYGKVECAMLPPALIDGLCKDDGGLDCLRSLKYLYFAGAPLARKSAERLVGHVTLKPAMGSTEAGAYFLQNTGDEDWEFYSFRPAMGLEIRRVADDLYEPIFVRQPTLQRWQQVFYVYPQLEEFSTKDLFSPHPSKPGFWRYSGRMDDVIILSHGECLYATGLEEGLAGCPGVSAVLIGGQGRIRPFALVEWKDGPPTDAESLKDWQDALGLANKSCSDLVKIRQEMVQFTLPGKDLVRTSKGSVMRRESEQLYAKEIELLYQN